MRYFSLLTCLLVGFVMAENAVADVPNLTSYQGLLLDANGDAVNTTTSVALGSIGKRSCEMATSDR